MAQFKFRLFKGLVEIVSTGELPMPLVYALSFLLIAIGIRVILWAF